TGTSRCATGESSTVTSRGSRSCPRRSAPRGSTTSAGVKSSRTLSAASVSGRSRVTSRLLPAALSSSRRGPTTVARSGSGSRITDCPAGGCTRTRTVRRLLADSSLEATSHSTTDSATEVALSGQSARNSDRSVTSAPAPALVQQPLDQRPVHRGVPVVRADHPLHDHAPPVEQEALRHPGGLIDLLDPAGAVLEQIEAEPEPLAEVPDLDGVALVDAHRRDAEPAGSERPVELLHGRHLDPAGLAPGGPDVHQRDRAAIAVPEAHRVSGGEVHRPEVRRPAPDGDGRPSPAVAHQRADAEAEQRQ